MNPNRGFSEMYRCYSIAMMQSGSDRDNVSYGGKSKPKVQLWLKPTDLSSFRSLTESQSMLVYSQLYYHNQL